MNLRERRLCAVATCAVSSAQDRYRETAVDVARIYNRNSDHKVLCQFSVAVPIPGSERELNLGGGLADRAQLVARNREN